MIPLARHARAEKRARAAPACRARTPPTSRARYSRANSSNALVRRKSVGALKAARASGIDYRNGRDIIKRSFRSFGAFGADAEDEAGEESD